ncbi:hypothetical protein [Limnobacter alexandrii]|jgi:hypothetical protein|uniref:hypothetical protein n=1 Tax=Limnobacter alexandrii TaxID=2570352 RepID=UPI001107FF1A|nr:hypothetical protein [Limnobacter alexandrii]
MNNIQFFSATHMEYMNFLLGQPLFESPVNLLRLIKLSLPLNSSLDDRLDPVCFSSSKYCYAIGDIRIFEVPLDEENTLYQIVSKQSGVLAFAYTNRFLELKNRKYSFQEKLECLDSESLHPLLPQELVRLFGPNGDNIPDNANQFSIITDFAVTRSYEDQAAALLDLLITALNELHMGTVIVYSPIPATIERHHPLAFQKTEDLPVGWLGQRTTIFETVRMANMYKLNQQFSAMQTLTQLGSCFFFNMPFFAHFSDSPAIA